MIFNKFIRVNLLLLVLVCGCVSLTGQIANTNPSGIIHHYSTEDGLSHSGIMCMLQDKMGFMWFGTWDGLNKFDGYKFTTYKSKPGGINSLSHNRIDEIKEDNYGFLWVRTYDQKVHRFNYRTETFHSIPEILNYSGREINISRIICTSSGNIWLLTSDFGCFQVNTHPSDFSFSAVHYSTSSKGHALKGNVVRFIFEDANNNTWIATNKGITCNTPDSKYIKFLKTIDTITITSFLESNNIVWLGSETGKVYTFNIESGEFETMTIPGKPTITSIIKPSADRVLFGTLGKGLIDWNIALYTFTSIPLPENNPGGTRVESFYPDNYGLIWVETNTPGVFRYNPSTFSVKHFLQKTDKVSPYVYYGDYYTLFEDTNGFLWINLKGGGFCYYNRSKDEVEYFYNEPGSLTRRFSNLVTFALSDTHGNLWLSTHSRGIEKVCFIKEKFRLFQPSPGSQVLSANEVRAMFEDNNEFLWVSTKEGKLYCYDKQRKLRKIFSGNTGDINFSGMIYTIIQDRHGAFWMGTKGDGVIKVIPVGDPEKLKFKTEHFRHKPSDPSSISNNWVYNIFEDSKGRIWIGTYGGGLNLLVSNNKTPVFYHYANKFKHYPHPICDKIRYIQEDTSGAIWVGSTNGLIVFNPNEQKAGDIRFNLFQKESGKKTCLANNDVHYILRSASGTMWVSTFGGGLGKVVKTPFANKAPEFKIFTQNNGLPIDIILSMMEDSKGNLWLSTENGISKFDPFSEEFSNYNELDGIKNLIFSEASCCKSQRGELYFGSYDGYYSFKSAHLQKEIVSPKVMLVNFQLFNRDIEIDTVSGPLKQSVNLQKSITLTNKQSVFSIEYAGLDYRNTEKLEYAFKLEGFEQDWNYVRHQRKATYTNLPAGKYVFKVICTSTGVFDEKAFQQIEILILPPWWKTTWAYAGYLILLVLSFVIGRRIALEIIRLRNKVIIEHKLSELKIKFFTNISHELRTPLTLILGPVEELMKKEDANKRNQYYLDIINKNARRMLRQINHLLDFRKVQTGNMRLQVFEIEIVEFVKDIFNGFREFAVSRSVDYHYHSNVERFTAWLDLEKLDTVVFNLLSNAFKFTPEGKSITLSVNYYENKGMFQIIVSDKGVGIAKEDLPLLFERFAISHKSTNLNSKGTGIGLSLVKEIVNLHKGKVSVESKIGEGSTFTLEFKLGNIHFEKSEISDEAGVFEFPLHTYGNEEVKTLFDSRSGQIVEDKLNTPTILVVEDNVELRLYLCNHLKDQYNVVDAVDGLDGLHKAQSAHPDLIISDIMMPQLNGIELVDKLRSDFKTSHIPIILLSAKSAIENIIEGLKYGADAYVTKPFSMDLLLVQIANLVEQRKKLVDKFSTNLKVMDLSPNEIVVTARDEQFLKDVIKIIEDNISDSDFNVEKIAAAVSLGRTTFFKKLKGLTGFAPVEFMKEMKLKRGYQLLETSEYTVSEIAYMIGFSDAGYFTKCFKEKYHTTPTEVIKKHKNN